MCAFVGSKNSYLAVWQLTGFITFQGKEHVRLKWENKKRKEWVERSEYIQERPLSERKHQKPEVLTSTKIGELSDNPSERKVNVKIVLSDKQEAYLKVIYHRMPTEAEELIARDNHKRHLMWRSGKSVLHDLWIFGQEKLSVPIKQ